jgi:hypothetical protein
VAGLGAGLLTDHVAHVRADALSQRTLEGRLGLGERLGEVAQSGGLAPLLVTMGDPRGHRWHHARVLVTEDGAQGPLEMLQGLQERGARRLLRLAPPATATPQARRQRAQAPNVWRTALGGQAIEGDAHTALRLSTLGQSVALLPLVAGQQGEGEGRRESAPMGGGEGEL